MAQSGDKYHGHWRYCDQCQAADRGEIPCRCVKGQALKESDDFWRAEMEKARKAPKLPRSQYDREYRRR